jgi:hypothetical protein
MALVEEYLEIGSTQWKLESDGPSWAGWWGKRLSGHSKVGFAVYGFQQTPWQRGGPRKAV